MTKNIWLENYPPGIPSEINPDAYQSIIEIFDISCKKFHDRPAFHNMGVTLTYAQIDQHSREFSAYLQQELKLKKGDRIAIMLPNILQYPIAMFGAMRAGLIVVNINPLYTANELSYQLNDSGAKTIIVLSHFTETLKNALSFSPKLKNIIITAIEDLLTSEKNQSKNSISHFANAIYFNQVLDKGKELTFSPVSLTHQDIAFLQYTGGTTGVTKAAMLTHGNIVANLQQAEAWMKSALVEGQEIIITALPLYHIFSLLANCLFFNKMGTLNVLITNPRDITSMINEIRKFKFTAITGVNTLFNSLLQHPDFSTLDFSQFRLTIAGGMAVQRIVAEKWRLVTGVHILEAYGLTETSPCVAINPTTLDTYNGTIGLPLPSTDIAIFDDNGQELSIGDVGELAIKGPQVMKGYWQNPTETEKVFTKDKWLLTGDIASINEYGYLRILERKKDLILVSGFKVYPNEVENIIAKIHGVREVAVVGKKSEASGEAVKAFIVKDDKPLSEEEVIQYCREYLTAYKVPKHIEFCSELPKTNVGKILRRALRDKSN
ncbi:MAG: AMP-binding protein [Gammaproteobacteria bacterium]|nr:AMP-binding protein [Gammaproteobacteria bacterium]MCW5584194.1 AMP-binding protein [Gammaproteobacteria bacterium]